MALVMAPELVSRFIRCLQPVVSTAAITILGAATTFAPQAFRHPAIETAQREIGEFAFHNGALLPHPQYLYGVDHNGESYIVGKKLAGQDYSAWEAEYANFPSLGSQTIERPGAKVTCSWSLEAPEPSTSPIFWQILFWFVLALFCGAVLRNLYLRYSARRDGNKNRIVQELAGELVCKYRELMRKYRELMRTYGEVKSHIMSLTTRVFRLDKNIRKTRKLVRKERKQKKAARTAILRMKDAARAATLRMKSEHATKSLEQQKEIDGLQKEFDSLQQKLDSYLESSDHADAEGENAETDNAQAPPSMHQPETSTDPVTDHDDAAAEAGDGTAGATGTADGGQDEKSPAGHEPRAGQGDKDGASGAQQDGSFPTSDDHDASQGDVDPSDAAHQDAGPSRPNWPLPGLDMNGNPRKPRINKRKDGTIRSTNHPDYVPRQQPQNRGNGGWGRGGNWGAGPYGWRDGRSERGVRGRGGGYGPNDQGRGGGYGPYNQGRGQ